MDDVLAQLWGDFVARTQGPMWVRLILQPLVAIVFGVRAGLRNARRPEQPRTLGGTYRREMLRQAWGDLGKVALVGIVLDGIVSWIVLRAVYPAETLLVVFLIVVVPYQIIRTAVARLAGARQASRAD